MNTKLCPLRILAPALIGAIASCLVLSGCSDLVEEDGQPGDEDAATGECPEPTGDPMERGGFIEADETWGPGVHYVSSEVAVRPGVTLTIEPCAVVRLAPNRSIAVHDQAVGIIAVGTPTRPILFERADASQAWGSLNVFAPATIRLEHAILRGGGTTEANPRQADYVGATLVGRNQKPQPLDTLLVRHVAIDGSNGLGVMLDSTGFIEGSTSLTVTGSGLNPVYLGAAYATNLPTGTYTGNGDNQFLLQSAGPVVYDSAEPILWDATIPARGLPYLVGIEGTHPSIEVGDGREESPGATLTIEPGVELRFQGRDRTSTQLLVRGKPAGGQWVPQGALIAHGTAAEPIIFTSSEPDPQPGDWQGLYFKNAVDPATSISNVRIAFAGGESTSTGLCVSTQGAPNNDADCSVVLFLDVPPTEQFIRNSVIENGQACGIYRGWTGDALDFTATNTFSNLTGCDQSNVYNEVDRCTGGTCQ
jgi:hypothetical protein